MWAKRLLVPSREDRTPEAADCLAVVTGVNAGERALDSVRAEPWWFGRGPGNCAEAGVGGEKGADEMRSESGIVDFALLELQVNAWPLCDAV